MNLIKPKALRRGDTIGVVAPAGPVERERIDRALERVCQRGFRIKTYGDIYRRTDYLASDDATRADELMAAFADSETSAVWCARGGYGVVRLLQRIDFELIRCNPKVFIGFSDITALHIAIQQRAGLVTFHGPNLQDGFGKPDDMPAANEAALWRAVSADEQSALDAGYTFDFPNLDSSEMRPITTGIASGRLTGGNLAVICGLMGTPFEIETAGRILFLEDVSERLYRIDRYLAQLSLAGKLQSAAGILLGTFSYEDSEPAESHAAITALLDEYLGWLGIPVISGFPSGHAQYNLTLPMGALVEIDANSGCVKVLENPVSP
ncbi:MAG: LD-carboxypeptidase [Planctomycetes bacterium]|nr:LD-carboxypeptidase [Planctomycetota bacterium]